MRVISPKTKALLSELWRGIGFPVRSEAMIDELFANRADGGPSPGSCYLAFNRTMASLHEKLVGTGIIIEPNGHRRGWRVRLAAWSVLDYNAGLPRLLLADALAHWVALLTRHRID